ncbi:MAG: hypothetical protein I3274_05900 [Candidatus Moeniiplasma glomeromycotorum]|nr:hypothetical protein [Candidatus Moeniiplasma glomeromycotorum]
MFKIANTLGREKRDKEAEKRRSEKGKNEAPSTPANDYWQESASFWQESADFWKKYNKKEYDWQNDLDKKLETNKKGLENSEKNRDDKDKQEFITDIEMELTKENITDERLSKRLNVSDWRDKIRQANGFSQALSMRSHLWDIIRKLGYEYTCANCGVKKEEFTVYEVGSKKCCSSECRKALRNKDGGKDKEQPKNDEKDNHGSTEPKWEVKKVGFSDIGDFLAWMKKLGISELKFDPDTNQVVIKLKTGKNLDIKKTGLTAKQQEELTQQLKSSNQPITYSGISSQVDKGNNGNKNDNSKAGIIAAIVIVGIIFTVIISVVIYNSRKKKDY